MANHWAKIRLGYQNGSLTEAARTRNTALLSSLRPERQADAAAHIAGFARAISVMGAADKIDSFRSYSDEGEKLSREDAQRQLEVGREALNLIRLSDGRSTFAPNVVGLKDGNTSIEDLGVAISNGLQPNKQDIAAAKALALSSITGIQDCGLPKDKIPEIEIPGIESREVATYYINGAQNPSGMEGHLIR
jgi:hypothetical protein